MEQKETSFRIRPALEEDSRPISFIQREIISKQEGLLALSLNEATETRALADIQSLTPGSLGLVAEAKTQVVGYCFLHAMDLAVTRHVVRVSMAVHPTWEGLGIGRSLLQTGIEWAKENQEVKKIELNVRPTNPRALSLYKKFGFKTEGVHTRRIRLSSGFADDISMALFVD